MSQPVLSYQDVSRLSETSDIENNSLLTLETHLSVISKIKDNDNNYATSKSTSQSLLNLSVVQSQISLLVNVIAGPLNGWAKSLVTLLSLSLILQLIIFVLLIILAKTKEEKIGTKFTATGINAFVTALSGVLLMTTSAITAVSKFSPTNSTIF
jgi:hypothetical protein